MGKLRKFNCEKCGEKAEFLYGGLRGVEMKSKHCPTCKKIIDKTVRLYKAIGFEPETINGMYAYYKKELQKRSSEICMFCEQTISKDDVKQHFENHIKQNKVERNKAELEAKRIEDNANICNDCNGELEDWDVQTCPVCQTRMKEASLFGTIYD
tara:strand:- start:9458 stop:9919 length:462 start_codon:yes stop_codon:yes gene_type:complete